jgi:anti-sigma regulatory factor (Ser/Thr protein kinase)
MRGPTVPVSRSARAHDVELPRDPRAGAEARAYIDEHLAPGLPASAARDLKLVASELVNNAVLHGRGSIVLRLRVLRAVVRAEVVDDGSGQTPGIVPQRPAADAPGGRGLLIVDALAHDWGAYEGTTHVWADILLR